MTLTHLGECCNQVNIQSDGAASVDQPLFMGDYEKNGNVYRNIMNSDQFLYTDLAGYWMVCNNCQCSFLCNNLLTFMNIFLSHVNHVL